jgi:hypothetical protein
VLVTGCRSEPVTFDFGDGGLSVGPSFGPSGPPCPGADDAGIVALEVGDSYAPGDCDAGAPRCVAYAVSCVDHAVGVRSWDCVCSGGQWSCDAAAPLGLGPCELDGGADSGTD